MCPTIRIEAAAGSHTGCVRRKNEDSFAALPELGLFMVADGMGGRAGGEIASCIAVETVRACFDDDDPEETLPDALRPMSDQDPARLVAAVRCANRRIREAARRDPRMHGMGTTFAGMHVSADGACIAHVGDSRVYRFREGLLERLTRDHSLAEALADGQGHWDLDDLIDDEDQIASVITRALGTDEIVEVDARMESLRTGDLFLVCSDGLWGPVPDQEIAAILARASSLPAATAALIGRALERGGPDNITCVLARCAGG